jgi:hypothetical protein
VPDPADASRTLLGEAMPAQVPVGMEFLGVPFSDFVADRRGLRKRRTPSQAACGIFRSLVQLGSAENSLAM